MRNSTKAVPNAKIKSKKWARTHLSYDLPGIFEAISYRLDAPDHATSVATHVSSAVPGYSIKWRKAHHTRQRCIDMQILHQPLMTNTETLNKSNQKHCKANSSTMIHLKLHIFFGKPKQPIALGAASWSWLKGVAESKFSS